MKTRTRFLIYMLLIITLSYILWHPPLGLHILWGFTLGWTMADLALHVEREENARLTY